MIELNKKTQQDFLNRKWVQRLLDAGVDMSDAKYIIAKDKLSMYDDEPNLTDYIWYKDSTAEVYDVCSTYTVSELLYKLHEYIYPTINGKEFSGGLRFIKDAPFYIFYYDLKSKDYDPLKFSQDQPEEWDESFSAEFEYPIESLAYLLILCHKKDIGIKDDDGNQISDVGNISDK